MYLLLRTCLRPALHLFCGRIRAQLPSIPATGPPLLVAANHPNAFLDALLIGVHLPCRLLFLARGDAFRRSWADALLRRLYMVPIHRLAGGRDALQRTGESLHEAVRTLARGGSVLVFAEGRPLNTMDLQPLGKGAARMALRAWHSEAPAVVMPTFVRYGTFGEPFPRVWIGMGPAIHAQDIPERNDARFLRAFNRQLRRHLLAAAAADTVAPVRMPRNTAALLLLPAMVGLVLHAPWYMLLRSATLRLVPEPVYFDSVLFTLCFLSYPLWLLLLAGFAGLFGAGIWAICALPLVPASLVALRWWWWR